MRKFIITSDKIEGRIVLMYKNTKLINVDIQAELTDEQLHWFFGHVPIFLAKVASLSEGTGMKVMEELVSLTFEDFYDAYGYKHGKLKAEKAWQRMSHHDQMQAYLWIPRYKSWLKTNNGIAQLMPATYLNAKRWED